MRPQTRGPRNSNRSTDGLRFALLFVSIAIMSLTHPLAPAIGSGPTLTNRGAGSALPGKDTVAPSLGEGMAMLACAGLRASGNTPIRQGQAGYSLYLDSDRDGLACE